MKFQKTRNNKDCSYLQATVIKSTNNQIITTIIIYQDKNIQNSVPTTINNCFPSNKNLQ